MSSGAGGIESVFQRRERFCDAHTQQQCGAHLPHVGVPLEPRHQTEAPRTARSTKHLANCLYHTENSTSNCTRCIILVTRSISITVILPTSPAPYPPSQLPQHTRPNPPSNPTDQFFRPCEATVLARINLFSLFPPYYSTSNCSRTLLSVAFRSSHGVLRDHWCSSRREKECAQRSLWKPRSRLPASTPWREEARASRGISASRSKPLPERLPLLFVKHDARDFSLRGANRYYLCEPWRASAHATRRAAYRGGKQHTGPH